MNTLTELDRFDDRLDACLSARPHLAASGRISVPLRPPVAAAAEPDEMAFGSSHSRPAPPQTLAQARAVANAAVAHAFMLMDRDGNGALSRPEVLDALGADTPTSIEVRRLLGLPDSREAQAHTKALFAAIDIDDSGTITLDEFAKAFRSR